MNQEEKMTKNLLKDCWLQVQSQQQISLKKINLAQISDRYFIDVYAPRADFKGALYQFLIGLLQVSFAPERRKEWIKYWQQAPTETELTQAFQPYLEVFELANEMGKPAFMQDLELAEGTVNDISSLFIEAPGDNTIKNNQDHFIKRGTIQQVSPYWAAIALFTLQINAPSGGQGHRVSLRGGGPLTTLVLPPPDSAFNTLWHRLWLNVLTQEEMEEQFGVSMLKKVSDIFPWMAKTRISKAKGSETYPQHTNPLQMYWSMPRRIRLKWTDTLGLCDVSGESSDNFAQEYITQNYGVNYAGSWEHPLTPYVFETGKEPYSIKAQPGGIGYRHWLELAAVNEEEKKKRHCAKIVEKYGVRHRWIKTDFKTPQLWTFGYDMDNMKARCWYEATMPLYSVEAVYADELRHYVKTMIHDATEALYLTKQAIKIAWYENPKDDPNAKKFNEKAVAIDSNFWKITEERFYQLLGQQVDAVQQDEKMSKQLLNQWRAYLKNVALNLFDSYALSSGNEDGDFKRLIRARHGKRETEKGKKKDGLEYWLNIKLKPSAV